VARPAVVVRPKRAQTPEVRAVAARFRALPGPAVRERKAARQRAALQWAVRRLAVRAAVQPVLAGAQVVQGRAAA
jgi:hypothetical protein